MKITTSQMHCAEEYHQDEMYYGMVKLLPTMLAKAREPISIS
jgi:hypothetical protein